jgi:hypothetical protein
MKKYLVIGIVLVVSACSTTYKPMYMYNEILVVNNSRELLQEVTITAPSTGRTFSCGNIAPLGICSNHFDNRRYQYNPIRISWVVGNFAQQTEEFVVPVPDSFATGVPLKGVLAVSAEGQMSAYFQQETLLLR